MMPICVSASSTSALIIPPNLAVTYGNGPKRFILKPTEQLLDRIRKQALERLIFLNKKIGFPKESPEK